MIARSVGIVGVVLVALAVSGPARAFSDESGNDGSSAGVQQDASPYPPPADYRYSGNGFNVSMSRNLTQPDGNPDADSRQPQPRQSQPGFFGRMLHSIFGD